MSAVAKVCYKFNFNGQVEILESLNLSQQTRDIDPMLDHCWASGVEGGPTLVQHLVDVSCLPGMGMDVPAHTCPEVRPLYEQSENIFFRLRHFTEIVSENYLNLSKYLDYSTGTIVCLTKMKVSFSVSSQSILKRFS